jgi:hypothetical protein
VVERFGPGCARLGGPDVGFATCYGGAAELFYGVVDGSAGLLAEDLSEEHAEGADVTAEGGFFQLARGRLKLGKALGPGGGSPK